MGQTSKFVLTDEEHNELVDARKEAKKSKDFELANRIRAILLLGSEGKKRAEVAEICDCSLRSVFHWQNKYRNGGVAALPDDYKPRECSLSCEQQAILSQLVNDGPEAAGFDTGTWTAALLSDVVRERFGVVYTVSGMTRLLHRLNFSVQLPQVQLARADPRAQKRWAQKTYPAIQRRARKERGVVFFSETNASSNNPDLELELGHQSG
jgi:transposase